MWSRDPAVGLFAVLPLWLCYEVLRLTLAPEERNGAELMVSEVSMLPWALRPKRDMTLTTSSWIRAIRVIRGS